MTILDLPFAPDDIEFVFSAFPGRESPPVPMTFSWKYLFSFRASFFGRKRLGFFGDSVTSALLAVLSTFAKPPPLPLPVVFWA